MSSGFELIGDERGGLILRRPGQDDVKDVRVRRSFPWSGPTRFISIRGSDGKELLLIDDLAALDPEVRRAVETALVDGTFIPRITRILEIDTRFGHMEWTVETDRGPASFRVQEREDVRFLGDGRFNVKDADGNIYELPRLDHLDHASRHRVERVI